MHVLHTERFPTKHVHSYYSSCIVTWPFRDLNCTYVPSVIDMLLRTTKMLDTCIMYMCTQCTYMVHEQFTCVCVVCTVHVQVFHSPASLGALSWVRTLYMYMHVHTFTCTQHLQEEFHCQLYQLTYIISLSPSTTSTSDWYPATHIHMAQQE